MQNTRDDRCPKNNIDKEQSLGLIAEQANELMARNKTHEAEMLWKNILKKTFKNPKSHFRKLSITRLNQIYRSQGLHDSADKLPMPHDHKIKLISEIEKSGILNSCSDITIIIVPQIELSPYIAAFLRKYGNKLPGRFLILLRNKNIMSRELLLYSERCFAIDFSIFSQWTEQKVNVIYEIFTSKEIGVQCLVAHPFERVSGIAVSYLQSRFKKTSINKFPNYVFYSDGSRNNKESEEHSAAKKGNAFRKVLISELNIWLCEFGFTSKSQLLDISNIKPNKKLVVEYEWLDFCYSQIADNMPVENKVASKQSLDEYLNNSALILNRYWGRGPYIFDSEKSLMKSMRNSIINACPDVENIIIRLDSRCFYQIEDLVTYIDNKAQYVNIVDIDKIIKSGKCEIKNLIFEYIMHKTEGFIGNIKYIYSFDSSFPLVFLSPRLKEKLHDDIKLIVGFDYKSVSKNATSECLRVMEYRTVVLIEDILNLSLFTVTDKFGILAKNKIKNSEYLERHEIQDRLRSNGGFFKLEK